MLSIDLAGLTRTVIGIAQKTGGFLLTEIQKVKEIRVEEKSLNSLVSYVDRTAEEMIVEQLKKCLPEAGFITEEETVSQSEGTLRWIIDPLDGTTNFLYGLPCFAVSIALELNGILQLGVVYEPNRDECFYAWKDGGAWLNKQIINCRQNSALKTSVISTGFPYRDFSRIDQYLQLFKELNLTTRGIRRWGAAAVDLAYVAAGRYDGFFEYGLSSWDMAAGALIIKEAGGKVTDFQGETNFLQNGHIVAGGIEFHSQLLDKVQKHMIS